MDSLGNISAVSGDETIELFVLADDENETDAIFRDGLREAITKDGHHAQDYLGRSLYAFE